MDKTNGCITASLEKACQGSVSAHDSTLSKHKWDIGAANMAGPTCSSPAETLWCKSGAK